MSASLRITIFNEFIHERENDIVNAIYPEGIHKAIADGLDASLQITFATQDMPQHGLTEEVLRESDVLIWWGHKGHKSIEDAVVTRVQERVLMGMGLIVLHSAHFSKIFKKLMGTTCNLKWRDCGEKERLWVVSPGHPIVEGVGEYFELEKEEMYGEHFDIPQPDELILASWFEGGELFRSGCTFTRGQGKIFYFRPGHESFPTYYNRNVQRIISNAVYWASPTKRPVQTYGNFVPSLEEIKSIG